MKIYKSLQGNDPTISKSRIKELLNNNCSLNEKMVQLRDSLTIVKLTPDGENELIRLLVEGLGLKIYFPRKGDNSERFDALIDCLGYKSVVEIEIPSTEILDAPRNLLDDYAVLKCRKQEKETEVVPLVICWDLPNKRTDYWNVVTDINAILGIKIKTLSVLALALHYWTGTPLDLQDDDYYLDHANNSMSKATTLLEKANLPQDAFPGYFSPYK